MDSNLVDILGLDPVPDVHTKQSPFEKHHSCIHTAGLRHFQSSELHPAFSASLGMIHFRGVCPPALFPAAGHAVSTNNAWGFELGGTNLCRLVETMCEVWSSHLGVRSPWSSSLDAFKSWVFPTLPLPRRNLVSLKHFYPRASRYLLRILPPISHFAPTAPIRNHFLHQQHSRRRPPLSSFRDLQPRTSS